MRKLLYAGSFDPVTRGHMDRNVCRNGKKEGKEKCAKNDEKDDVVNPIFFRLYF